MSEAVFSSVLVPVVFEAGRPNELAVDRSVQLSDGEWVVIGPSTLRALELANALAAGGQVRLVHATPDYHSVAVYGSQEGLWLNEAGVRELDETAKRRSLEVLGALAKRHCRGVTVINDVGPGRPIDVIEDAARRNPPDAIILAASGHGRMRRVVLGSTADKLIRRAVCPVVVVPGAPT